MIDPGQGSRDIRDLPAGRGRRAFDQHDRQAERSGGVELRFRAGPPGVPRDYQVDGVFDQQRAIAVGIERSAGHDDMMARQRRRRRGRIDETQQVPVPGPRREGFEPLPAEGEENPPRRTGQRLDRRHEIGNRRPSVSGARAPWWSGKRYHWDAALGARSDGIAADLRREGMRGVDQMGDALGPQMRDEPRHPAEPADAHRKRLRARCRRSPRVGERRPLALRRQGFGEPTGFGGSAENEDVASHG